MNKTLLIDFISKHLDNEGRISEDKFEELFNTLEEKEREGIRLSLYESGIMGDGPGGINLKATNKIIKAADYVVKKNLKTLNNEELCIMYQEGNELALTYLMEKNEKLVWSRVRKYFGRYKHKLELEDLLAFGNMGMLKAAERYDASYESRFSTYAIHWIDQAILRSIADLGFTIRIPVHIFESVNKLARAEREYPDKSEEEICKILETRGISAKKYEKLKIISRDILTIASLNSVVGDGEESELSEFIADEYQVSVEAAVEKTCLRESIDEAMKILSDREQDIIRLRFGLTDGIPKTLEEVGQMYGLTRERIRQIEAKSLKKLKAPCRADKIRAYSIR